MAVYKPTPAIVVILIYIPLVLGAFRVYKRALSILALILLVPVPFVDVFCRHAIFLTGVGFDVRVLFRALEGIVDREFLDLVVFVAFKVVAAFSGVVEGAELRLDFFDVRE